MNLLTSKDWEAEFKEKYDLKILDYDGWRDKSDVEYSFNHEEITKGEFIDRMFHSKTSSKNNMMLDLINSLTKPTVHLTAPGAGTGPQSGSGSSARQRTTRARH